MALIRVRALLLVAALVALAANGAGVYMTLARGLVLGSWQITCLGVGIPAACLAILIAWHRPRNRIAWVFATAALQFGLQMTSLGLIQGASVPGALQRLGLAGLEVGLG